MTYVHRVAGAAVLLLGLTTLSVAGLDADTQAPPVEVTTDTRAYCQRLSNQVSERMRELKTAPPADVQRLSGEGERLCDAGQTRGGILRLRRAWLMITHPDEWDDNDPH
jgi:hypothetical protein